MLKTAIFGAGHNSAAIIWNKQKGLYSQLEIVGFIDDKKTGEWCGLPILSSSNNLESLKDKGIQAILVTAIAKARERLTLCEKIEKLGFEFPAVIPELPPWIKIGRGIYVDPTAVLHGTNISLGDYSIVGPLAYIEGDVELGRGAISMAQSFVGFGSKIGEASCICQGAIVKPRCTIGKDCYINPMKIIEQGLELKDGSEYPTIHRER